MTNAFVRGGNRQLGYLEKNSWLWGCLGYKAIQILEFIKAKKCFFVSRGKIWSIVFGV
jgi:hypothetical protein